MLNNKGNLKEAHFSNSSRIVACVIEKYWIMFKYSGQKQSNNPWHHNIWRTAIGCFLMNCILGSEELKSNLKSGVTSHLSTVTVKCTVTSLLGVVRGETFNHRGAEKHCFFQHDVFTLGLYAPGLVVPLTFPPLRFLVLIIQPREFHDHPSHRGVSTVSHLTLRKNECDFLTPGTTKAQNGSFPLWNLLNIT